MSDRARAKALLGLQKLSRHKKAELRSIIEREMPEALYMVTSKMPAEAKESLLMRLAHDDVTVTWPCTCGTRALLLEQTERSRFVERFYECESCSRDYATYESTTKPPVVEGLLESHAGVTSIAACGSNADLLSEAIAKLNDMEFSDDVAVLTAPDFQYFIAVRDGSWRLIGERSV
jgi:hypothetical protein